MDRITTQSLFQTSVHKCSWRSYVVSMVVHAGLATFAFAIVIPVAVEVRNSLQHAVLVDPIPEYKAKSQQARLIAPTIPVRPVIPPPIKTFVPPPLALPTVKPQQVMEPPEIKPVQPQSDLKMELPPAPKAPIQTGVFQPTSELAKAALPPQTPKMQVGGFGDPHGVNPSDSAHNSPVTLTKVGTFDTPDGAGQHGRSGTSQNGGKIRRTGFGAPGELDPPEATSNAQSIRPTAFGDATLTPPPSARKAEVASDRQTTVEILFKPKPAYSSEARELRLEGEVALQVIFQANGAIRVVRVVRGLGHGLDEAAVQAATRVRFKPATRDGSPVDTSATIKISFELS